MAPRQRAVRGLATVTIDDLQAEMRRRQRGLADLHKRYDKAAAKAGALARQIEALGGSVSGAAGGRGGVGRTRPKNDQSLIEYLLQALKGKELGVQAVIEAVQKLGYKSHADNFRSIVNQALGKHKDKIKRVGRGVYTAK